MEDHDAYGKDYKEFQPHFEVIYETYRSNSNTDSWPKHIIANLHLLPLKYVNMMAAGLPHGCGWSNDVVQGARDFIAKLNYETEKALTDVDEHPL